MIEIRPTWKTLESIKLGGQYITTASRKEITEAMVEDCLYTRQGGFQRPPRVVFDANGQGLSMYETNPLYREAVNSADLIHADGGFLVIISRIFTTKKIAERSATTDLIHDFAKSAEQNGLSFYLLGGTEDVNRKCALELNRVYPGLNIVGARHGFFTDEQSLEVIREIDELRPDVLWVGLGKPKEQIFSTKWKQNIHCGWIVTCGGCFNFIAGNYKRAPVWMQKSGIEWMYRLYHDPRRLFLRYLMTSPHAVWAIIKYATLRRKENAF